MRTIAEFQGEVSEVAQGTVKRETWKSKATEFAQSEHKFGFRLTYTGPNAAQNIEEDILALGSKDYETTRAKHRNNPDSLLVELFVTKYPA